MSLENFLKRVLNESVDLEQTDEFSAVTEVYEGEDENDEDEWDDLLHTKMEAVKKVHLVRGGRFATIARSTRPGHKIAHGEERRMSLAERRARQRAAEKTFVRKKKWQNDKFQAQRKESIEKRNVYGLDKDKK